MTQNLVNVLKIVGSIPTVRVSSAQAKGAAGQYPYWGAVRYEIRLDRKGRPINAALERASSDRRSNRLAHKDAEATGRLFVGTIGQLSDVECSRIVRALGLV